MARLRTFIAVDPGKAIRDKAQALQEVLGRASPDVKWVEHDNLHVTLLFLGEVDDRIVPSVCRVVGECSAEQSSFTMAVEGVGCFPNARRPRTLWVGITDGSQELCALHDALEGPLLDLGCYRREERKYTPHLTIGRVKTDRPSDQLGVAIARQSAWHAGVIPVREVLVLSSELRPQGPVYSVLSRAKLG